MALIKTLDNYHIDQSWITIGSFDGVHLGHQALIRELIAHAHQQDCQAVVVTFHPHPAVFFKRVPQAYCLTSSVERENLLKELGVDEVITLPFDQDFADLSAREFVMDMKATLGLTHLMAGFNFALGKNRSGDITALESLGEELEFTVDVLPPLKISNEVISSSQIRKFLQDGEMRQANHYLGRAYSLEGKVIHGEHRGHELGFPTANLEIDPDRLLPTRGVYACKAIVDGKSFIAVTNVGIRPTFVNPLLHPRVEPHLLDLQEDLYGKYLKLEFIEYLRPEQAFQTPQELIEQVNFDIKRTRELLGHA
jgi:riboflavin kinase/FMN adenylyltransferase